MTFVIVFNLPKAEFSILCTVCYVAEKMKGNLDQSDVMKFSKPTEKDFCCSICKKKIE